jgi:hypothetical protein
MAKKRALFALILVLVVSCGGATPSSSGGASAGTSAATNTGAATGAATAGAGAAATGNAGAAAQPKLTEILSAAKLTQYKITYKLTATGAGAEAFSGDQTWYFKPPRSRFDFTSDFGGEKTTMSVFSLPDGSYMCFAMGGQTQCLSTPATGSPLDQNQAAMTQRSLIDHPDQYGAVFKESRTIAGQPALCYDVNAVASAATGFKGTFCYSKDGLALLSQFSVQGSTWSMEATNVSTTVPDSDFTLPAKPTIIGRP